MTIYVLTKLNMDDVFKIDNINYTFVIKENGDILLKKITNVNITNIKDIQNHDFAKSIIMKCLINNKEYDKLKYMPILKQVYTSINDGVKIIKNTKLNIKTIKYEDEGFYYLENIGISMQRVDANKCLLEIINQCIENSIPISMNIKLINNIAININFGMN